MPLFSKQSEKNLKPQRRGVPVTILAFALTRIIENRVNMSGIAAHQLLWNACSCVASKSEAGLRFGCFAVRRERQLPAVRSAYRVKSDIRPLLDH